MLSRNSGPGSAWRVRLWPPGDTALAEALIRWLELETVPGATRVGTRPVWLLPERGLCIKMSLGPRPAARVRKLYRAAAGHARIAPLPAPAPLALVSRRGKPASALAMTLVPGVRLDQAWDQPAAAAGLTALLVAMHRRRVAHGDLHPGNLLWDGQRLALIDLDGLRFTWQGLLLGRCERRAWAGLRLNLPDDGRLRESHRDWCTACGIADAGRHWQQVERTRRRLAARIAEKARRRKAE